MTTTAMAVTTVTFNGISGTALTNRSGKITGSRVVFSGDKTASAVREQLKASGLTGAELKKAVNEVLTGKQDVAWAKHDAAISLLRSNGFIPDYVDARKTGATARFVKPTVSQNDIAALTREAALKALGLDEDSFKLLAALAPAAGKK